MSNSYDEFRVENGVSQGSDEDFIAENAWNSSLDRLTILSNSAYFAENCSSDDARRLIVLILTEIEGLKTN